MADPNDFIIPDQPFSPLDAGILKSGARQAFFSSFVDNFSQYEERPQLIVGRRGSGKTAFLQSAHFRNQDDLIVEIEKSSIFYQIISAVSDIPLGGRYPEAIADLWDTLVMTTVLNEACKKFGNLKISKGYLAKIGANDHSTTDSISWTLLNTLRENSPIKTIASIADFISRLHGYSYHAAKDELFTMLNSRGERAIVLFDSLESEAYLIEDKDTVTAIRGWLKWLGNTAASTDPVQPRYCIPREYYDAFMEISSNPLKDFANCSMLRWKTRELILLAANRLQLYNTSTGTKKTQPQFEVPITSMEDARVILAQTFPSKITSGQEGEFEDALLYIVRHTQLLPRQFFIILNYVYRNNISVEEISESEIVSSVTQACSLIVNEIFSAYQSKYPYASKICKLVLPSLKEVFDCADLHKLLFQTRNLYSDDMYDIIEMMAEIGCIGRVVKNNGKYVEAQFKYNFDGLFSFPPDQKLCIHPSFFLSMRNDLDAVVSQVWPRT